MELVRKNRIKSANATNRHNELDDITSIINSKRTSIVVSKPKCYFLSRREFLFHSDGRKRHYRLAGALYSEVLGSNLGAETDYPFIGFTRFLDKFLEANSYMIP
jgi:hypothetical protein